MESVDDMQDSLLRTQLLTQIARRVDVREEEVLAIYHKGRTHGEQQAVADPWRLPRKSLGTRQDSHRGFSSERPLRP